MSIASEISRLQQAKADIKDAIEAKGVPVPSAASLDVYDTYIAQIQTGTARTIKVVAFSGSVPTFNDGAITY